MREQWDLEEMSVYLKGRDLNFWLTLSLSVKIDEK